MKPVEIKRLSDSGLQIRWDDGLECTLSSKSLREACPCAECREARGDTSHAKPLSTKSPSLRIIEATIDEQIRLEKIWAVGNYALGVRWGDSHDSGIYTFQVLREISQKSLA